MLYSTATAAERLGMAVVTVKYHLYIVKDLKPDYVIAGRLVFTEETLAKFEAGKGSPGRPSSSSLRGRGE
jgi:hypothetical protein